MAGYYVPRGQVFQNQTDGIRYGYTPFRHVPFRWLGRHNAAASCAGPSMVACSLPSRWESGGRVTREYV